MSTQAMGLLCNRFGAYIRHIKEGVDTLRCVSQKTRVLICTYIQCVNVAQNCRKPTGYLLITLKQ